MSGRVRRWAIAAALATSAGASAQSFSPAALASQGPGPRVGAIASKPMSDARGQAPGQAEPLPNEPELVMRTAGQPDRILRVVKRTPMDGGDSLVDVKDVVNGQVFTLHGKVVAKMQGVAVPPPQPELPLVGAAPPPKPLPRSESPPPPVVQAPKPQPQPRPQPTPQPPPVATEPQPTQRAAAVLYIPPPALPDDVVAPPVAVPPPAVPAPAVTSPTVQVPATAVAKSSGGWRTTTSEPVPAVGPVANGPFPVTLSSPTVLPIGVPAVMPPATPPLKPDRWVPARLPLDAPK